MSKTQKFIAGVTVLASLSGLSQIVSAEAEVQVPLYKPSSRSPEPIDISTNAYGASGLAPSAIEIAELAPDFDLPVSGGGTYQLSDADKPVAVIFYRGHW